MPYHQTIRVFEHQTLKVGEVVDNQCFEHKHLHAMAHFYEQKGEKYFRLVHEGIRFSHYVGAIQIGNLTIEILPKADQIKGNHDQWQAILLDLLSRCRLLKIDSLSSANLQLKPNSILDLYFEIFLSEVELLLRKGLCKSYNIKQNNNRVWKGQMLFNQQIRKNASHQERFFTRFAVYNHNHLVNRILYKALRNLKTILRIPALQMKLNAILEAFPEVTESVITERDFNFVFDNRAHFPYKKALEVARVLILNFSPDIRSGKHHLLAILFDMNVLFEEYVFQELKKYSADSFSISRQESRSFWNRRRLRPDIILENENNRIVLDTKWKILTTIKPSMEDLRQAYVYCRFFKANRTVLIYPLVYALKDLPPVPFEESNEKEMLYCQVKFVNIVKNGKLNHNMANEILATLEHTKNNLS